MYSTIKTYFSKFKKQQSIEMNPGKHQNSRNAARSRMLSAENPSKKNPHKIHSVKSCYIVTNDGIIVRFRMKKDMISYFMEITGLSHGSIKTYILDRRLDKLNVVDIVVEEKENNSDTASIGRRWYTNGSENQFVFPGNESFGFIPGLHKKSHRRKKGIPVI
jgi:hypothetical protein